MRDSRYTNEEILEWIYTEDDSLPAAPSTPCTATSPVR